MMTDIAVGMPYDTQTRPARISLKICGEGFAAGTTPAKEGSASCQ
jgi:hypothetical protein